MTAPPCTDVLADVARDLDGGARLATFYAVEHDKVIEYVWSGGNARRAHAKLARALTAWGVTCVDVPGMGVMVAKAKEMTCER